MTIAVWVALALLVAVLAVGGVHVVRAGLRTWRDAKRLMRVAEAGADALAARGDQAAGKADAAGAAGDRVAAAVGRLSASLAYARVIADAAGDVRATLTGLQGSVPRK